MDSFEFAHYVSHQYQAFLDGRLNVQDLDKTLREVGIYSDEPMDYCHALTSILWAYGSSSDEWDVLANAHLLTGNREDYRKIVDASEDGMARIMPDILSGDYDAALRRVETRRKAKEKYGWVSQADKQLQLQIRFLKYHADQGKLVVG